MKKCPICLYENGPQTLGCPPNWKKDRAPRPRLSLLSPLPDCHEDKPGRRGREKGMRGKQRVVDLLPPLQCEPGEAWGLHRVKGALRGLMAPPRGNPTGHGHFLNHGFITWTSLSSLSLYFYGLCVSYSPLLTFVCLVCVCLGAQWRGAGGRGVSWGLGGQKTPRTQATAVLLRPRLHPSTEEKTRVVLWAVVVREKGGGMRWWWLKGGARRRGQGGESIETPAKQRDARHNHTTPHPPPPTAAPRALVPLSSPSLSLWRVRGPWACDLRAFTHPIAHRPITIHPHREASS